MRNLGFAALCVTALAIAAGCHSAGSPPGFTPLTALRERSLSSTPQPACAAHGGGTITICLHIPIYVYAIYMTITDTVQGDPAAMVGTVHFDGSSDCNFSGSEQICVAVFNAPAALNQIAVTAQTCGSSCGLSTSYYHYNDAAFPVDVTSSTAAVENVIFPQGYYAQVASLKVYPFYSVHGALGALTTLPLGQSEHVWVVAKNAAHQIIAGAFKPSLSVGSTSSDLVPSLSSLNSTMQAEILTAAWAPGFSGVFRGSRTYAALRLSSGSSGTAIKARAPIEPAGGTQYYTPAPTGSKVLPGPVAVTPDGKSVYFMMNDGSGCQPSVTCATTLWLFTPSTQTFQSVSIPSVPGIDQLYIPPDGKTLWMSSYQPVGSWNAPLPVLHMPLGAISAPIALPTTFSEGSGFAEDGASHLWISGCNGTNCKANNNGSHVLVETSVNGSASAPMRTVSLLSRCTKFGSKGFVMGDVAYFSGSLYVIGVNNGSAPPARGAIWKVNPTKYTVTCPEVPGNFNPSAYFAATSSALVFGAGGSLYNARTAVQHGFYAMLPNGTLQSPAPDITPRITANHVSSANNLVYSVHFDAFAKRVVVLFGLSAYEQSSGNWAIYPAANATRGNVQQQDGVAAVGNDVWYTAAGTCPSNTSSSPWLPFCFGHATFVAKGKTAIGGAAPGLNLPPLSVGATIGYGAVGPLNVHSGEFDAKSSSGNSSVCTVQTPAPSSQLHFTFLLTGVAPGNCPVTITGSDGTTIPFITKVGSTPRP